MNWLNRIHPSSWLWVKCRGCGREGRWALGGLIVTVRHTVMCRDTYNYTQVEEA